MPYNEPHDTQPFRNREKKHRRYVPARWAQAGEGNGHPKLSGGYEVDSRGNPIPTRGLNRPDQRYAQDPATLQANRVARAATENATTLCLLGINNEIEVRGPSGNCYDVVLTNRECDCPDFLKLRQSVPDMHIDCKHILIAESQVQAKLPETLDWSVNLIAALSGYAISTIETLCRKGIIPAFKVNNVWVIPAGEGPETVTLLQSRII